MSLANQFEVSCLYQQEAFSCSSPCHVCQGWAARTNTCSDKKRVNQPFPKGQETLAVSQRWWRFLSAFLPADDRVTTLRFPPSVFILLQLSAWSNKKSKGDSPRVKADSRYKTFIWGRYAPLVPSGSLLTSRKNVRQASLGYTFTSTPKEQTP